MVVDRAEWLACSESSGYFVDNFCWLFNATERDWVRFHLWPAQLSVLDSFQSGGHHLVLKARQLGLSWLCLGYALWMILFRPAAAVLLFSKREDEAVDLLDFRLKGMYERLPDWMQCRGVEKSNLDEWRLSNGSYALAFPTTGGRSYTGSLVIGDEADFMPDLSTWLNATKPTVDAGGQILLVSTSDKKQPNSAFKRLFRSAWVGTNDYRAVFLPWSSRPGRDRAWYERVGRDMREQDGTDDNLLQEYPSTPEEAMQARTLDKRVPPAFLERCSAEAIALGQDYWDLSNVSVSSSLVIFRLPAPGSAYVVGADPAEGNPTSDESALTVLDVDSGEQVAVLAGRFDPGTFAAQVDQVARFYQDADVMAERNNHGHAVLLWLRENSHLRVLRGPDEKEGWRSSVASKTLLYDTLTHGLRDRKLVIHDGETIRQVGALEGASLRAPDGDHDDRSDALALAWAGALIGPGSASEASDAPEDPVEAADQYGEF